MIKGKVAAWIVGIRFGKRSVILCNNIELSSWEGGQVNQVNHYGQNNQLYTIYPYTYNTHTNSWGLKSKYAKKTYDIKNIHWYLQYKYNI